MFVILTMESSGEPALFNVRTISCVQPLGKGAVVQVVDGTETTVIESWHEAVAKVRKVAVCL